jgi:AGCS family alanine or glycine:cation symporter
LDLLNGFILSIDSVLGSAPWFPFVLLGVGCFFTFYLGFPQIRYFRHAWGVLTGKKRDGDAPGDTSHFQALTTALSGTVGTGNIGGVGLAIFLGGPAALFWMWATAFFGMASKFVEVTLSHKYRVVTDNGTMAGGPMYYMERRLKMKWLAGFFAVATVISSFGTGSMPQINNIAQSLNVTWGVPHMASGAVLSVLLFMVIVGGIKRIAKFTQVVVPGMAFLYLVGAAGVIFANLENIGPSFVSIFADAFSGSAATGGFLGATFAYAFNRGVNRGLYSNEAGQGSAPIAHAAARADEPVSEGMVSLLEPFIDTIIICTVTGLVILASGAWSEKFENTFQRSDMAYVVGSYTDEDAEDRQKLFGFLVGTGADVQRYTGDIIVRGGVSMSSGYTLLHARSIAEDVRYWRDDEPYTGLLKVVDGLPENEEPVVIRGKSLIHSAALTTKAFTYGFFGDFGQYFVAVGLVLFAFSTAVSWSYYGDRAMIYLVGTKALTPYRVVYCLGFFLASFMDTRLVWNLAAVTIVIMTLPNLFGIMLLHKEMKELVIKYWSETKTKGYDTH